MALWGVGTNNDESKPKWLTEEEKKNVYADDRGWVYVHPDGNEEVLVAVGQLSGTDDATGLAAPTVDFVSLRDDVVAQGDDLTLDVYYNEGVAVVGTPVVAVTGLTADLAYDSVNSTPAEGHLVFTGTTGTDSGEVTIAADTDITLSGGTITDAVDETTAAEVSLNNDAITATITV